MFGCHGSVSSSTQLKRHHTSLSRAGLSGNCMETERYLLRVHACLSHPCQQSRCRLTINANMFNRAIGARGAEVAHVTVGI